jgi:hypothetical protein
MSLAGVACASAGMSIIAAAAFPVQGEVLAMPLLGVAFLVVGAILLHVNPLSLSRSALPRASSADALMPDGAGKVAMAPTR